MRRVVKPDPSPAGIERLDRLLLVIDDSRGQRLELRLLLMLLLLLLLLGLSPRLRRRRMNHPLLLGLGLGLGLRLRLRLSLSLSPVRFSTKTGRGWNDEIVAQVPLGVVHADRLIRNLFPLPLLARSVRKVSGMLVLLLVFSVLSLPVVCCCRCSLPRFR